MVISRTPYRVSFFGGGTDYPGWYKEHPGATLATSIDKYCYITLDYLPPFFDCNYRIVYSKREMVKRLSEIQHPAVREGLRFLGVRRGISLQHVGDLPARAGIASSSAFTVGFLNALHALLGRMVSKKELALQAIRLEQDWMKENVGSQDQMIVSFGGFNKIEFKPGKHNIEVTPMTVNPKRLKHFQSHLLLFFTGFSRLATEVAGEQIRNIPAKKKELRDMYGMVFEAIDILNSDRSLDAFGKLLHKSWMLKRTLSSRITNARIDEIYRTARSAGAVGGKLLGAGGGGFMLIFACPEAHGRIKKKLKSLLHVPFKFEELGSQVIYYKPDTNF